MIRGERTEQAELGALFVIRWMKNVRLWSEGWNQVHKKR